MRTMPDVTVVSAFYNREDAVDLSVGSLAGQDYPDFRAVVVDDGSRDGTWEQLQRWRSERIEVRRQQNRGFTATMIALCEEAETEFVALHGAGDESLPHRLTAQVAFLRANPDVVAVGCGIENVDEVSGKHWEVRPPVTLRPGPIGGDFGISHGEVVFRRAAYLRTGGYRLAFSVGQASDLFRRLSRIGHFGYVDEVLYRRYLRLDGVNAKVEKVAERLVLAALSSAVHRRAVATSGSEASASLRDELDRYGLLLPYFGAPDRLVAKSLAQAAVLHWSAGDLAMARRLARRSLAEGWSRKGWAARVGTAIGIGPLRRPLEIVAARLSRGEGEFARDRLVAAGAQNATAAD